MKNMHGRGGLLAGLALGLAFATGCQTQVPATGQTLPSPRYLEHPPQFFAPSPPFPLQRELASQERAWADAGPAVAGADVPPRPIPVPPPGPGGAGAVPLPPPPPMP